MKYINVILLFLLSIFYSNYSQADDLVIRELQKELVTLIEAFGLQPFFVKIFQRIHESNMTKTCGNLQEAEESVRKIWDLHKQMVKFIYFEGKIILQIVFITATHFDFSHL